MKVKSLSCVRLFETPWTAAHQAPPSMGFSRQEYWSGCHCPLHVLDLLKTNDLEILQLPDNVENFSWKIIIKIKLLFTVGTLYLFY